MKLATRSAIPVHHTGTTDQTWDAGTMVRRIPNDAGGSALRMMFAWVDSAGDPDRKGSYKLPHHMVSETGSIGAANMRACSAGIAALNGARGGIDVPEADRKAVWNHLAAHMMDASMEPPQMASLLSAGGQRIERRAYSLTDITTESGDAVPQIRGHAAVFGQLSDDLGGFREQVAAGAFHKTIAEADIRALFNHNPDYVLGRTRSGTLSLVEDTAGLAVSITPPDTTYARDLLTSMQRGDVDQMSFGFRTVRDNWAQDTSGQTIRTLLEVRLYDVSLVTFPAYPQTDAAVRSALCRIGLDDTRMAVLLRAEFGPLDSSDALELRALIDEITDLLPTAPVQVDHPVDGPVTPAAPTAHGPSLSLLRRRLELAKLDVWE